MVLEPVVRDIPVGRPLSADSLYMHTEYDYYPVATSKVKVFITNRANQKYDSGERYSLVYYNEALKQWEPQPTNPIINDVLWVFTPDYPTHRQTIQFYTDKNRPGRYRIYKSFNRNTRTAYAEFELISKAQHRKLLDKISRYREPIILHTGRLFNFIRTRTVPAGIVFTNHSTGIHVRHTRSLNLYPRLSIGNCSTKLAGTGRSIPRTVS